MTFPHWSRVTLYTSHCWFAECCVFVKQSPRLFHCASGRARGPLLPKLRGQCAEFLNEVSLARLGIFVPFHLCRFWYGRTSHAYGAFLGSVKKIEGGGQALPAGKSSHPIDPLLLRTLSKLARLGNVDPMSIDYAFRPCLRIRLTPGGRTWPGKPWNSGGRDSHPAFRYSCPHNRLHAVHGGFPRRFKPHATLPYHPSPCGNRSPTSAPCLLPIIFGAGSLDQSAVTQCLNDGCL